MNVPPEVTYVSICDIFNSKHDKVRDERGSYISTFVS